MCCLLVVPSREYNTMRTVSITKGGNKTSLLDSVRVFVENMHPFVDLYVYSVYSVFCVYTCVCVCLCVCARARACAHLFCLLFLWPTDFIGLLIFLRENISIF